jgi:prepilin-type N-terminal cleavage/methylation domain-containing protein
MAPALLGSGADMSRNAWLSRRAGGFTLLELLVVLALIGVAVLFGFPAIQNMIQRSKLEGAARQTASLMQRARLESVKLGTPVTVLADLPADRVLLFTDLNADGVRNGTDRSLIGDAGYQLPAFIDFWGPPDPAPDGASAVDGFTETATAGWAIFDPDGSAREAGAFRFGDVKGNFLEVRVDPPATARVEVQKHVSGTVWQARAEGDKAWEWNY